jgi:hypothetical protein
MPTIVIFACPICGRCYRAVQELLAGPMQGGKFRCAQCKAIVHAWTGRYGYSAWAPEQIPDLD